MNRHFSDSWYYAKRTVVTAKKGVRTELEPILGRIRRFRGKETEQGRLEEAKERATEAAGRAKDEASTVVEGGRERVSGYRARTN